LVFAVVSRSNAGKRSGLTLWSVFIHASAESLDRLSADLWETGTAGLIEEAGGVRAFFLDSKARGIVCARFNLDEAAARNEEPFDQVRSIQPACDPVLIGERFFVAPSWVTEPGPADRFRLKIDATSAFGSGRHESTQMCIEALERHLKPGSMVLDVGCGSGILMAAAMLLGANTAIGCDIHEESVKAAQTLVETPLFVGSVDSVCSDAADIVLANISRRVLDAIAGDLRRVVKPEGIVVIAGFLRHNTPKRFTPHEVWEKAEWQCWLCRLEGIDASPDAGEPLADNQAWYL
jgi:ribosomal protein L11 methyltransferase